MYTNIGFETRWHHILRGTMLEGTHNQHLDHPLYILMHKVIPFYKAKHWSQQYGFQNPIWKCNNARRCRLRWPPSPSMTLLKLHPVISTSYADNCTLNTNIQLMWKHTLVTARVSHWFIVWCTSVLFNVYTQKSWIKYHCLHYGSVHPSSAKKIKWVQMKSSWAMI